MKRSLLFLFALTACASAPKKDPRNPASKYEALSPAGAWHGQGTYTDSKTWTDNLPLSCGKLELSVSKTGSACQGSYGSVEGEEVVLKMDCQDEALSAMGKDFFHRELTGCESFTLRKSGIVFPEVNVADIRSGGTRVDFTMQTANSKETPFFKYRENWQGSTGFGAIRAEFKR